MCGPGDGPDGRLGADGWLDGGWVAHTHDWRRDGLRRVEKVGRGKRANEDVMERAGRWIAMLGLHRNKSGFVFMLYKLREGDKGDTTGVEAGGDSGEVE